MRKLPDPPGGPAEDVGGLLADRTDHYSLMAVERLDGAWVVALVIDGRYVGPEGQANAEHMVRHFARELGIEDRPTSTAAVRETNERRPS